MSTRTVPVVDTPCCGPHNSHSPNVPSSLSRIVIPKRFLLVLVFALPILAVAFGVLMGAFALAQAMQDLVGARALLWVAISALLLLILDVVLLVMALGINAAQDRDREG